MALRSFREGDRVKVVVLTVDTEKQRISLGLKASYFAEDDFAEQSSDEDESDEPQTLGIVEEDEAQDESEDSVHEENSDGQDDDDDDEAMIVDEPELSQSFAASLRSDRHAARPPQVPTLKLDGGFEWSLDQDARNVASDSSDGEDEDEDEEQGGKKKKRRRKEIEQDLTADLHTKTPDSNADFERLLLGSPNSSYLWVQYMSFQLQLSEIEKARELAKRALKTINFREEQEKLNVWIALLNLENVYGTEESLEAAFKDAARHNDSKTIHLRLAAIFDQSEKFEVGQTLHLRKHPLMIAVYRKRKSNINGLARSSDRALKCGLYLGNTGSNAESWRRHVSCSRAACKVLKNANVRIYTYSFVRLH